MSGEGGWEAEVPEPYGSCLITRFGFSTGIFFFPPHHMLKASGRLFLLVVVVETNASRLEMFSFKTSTALMRRVLFCFIFKSIFPSAFAHR